ncbi:hypothetical protein T4D_1966 [Trichinella pseudospiralis]|uniref:Uncharacterized protein n=1 Tax=Trichinella pseudospiralis TaxID=6337 RepID=A0A0V1FDM6_TRIPS|nr:hypothetical protein T4D_1966 [Trichinella pseudospiralis]
MLCSNVDYMHMVNLGRRSDQRILGEDDLQQKRATDSYFTSLYRGSSIVQQRAELFLTFNRKPKNNRPHTGLLTQQLHASTSAVYPSLAQLTNNSARHISLFCIKKNPLNLCLCTQALSICLKLIGRKQAHWKDALYLQRQFSYNLSTCDLWAEVRQ